MSYKNTYIHLVEGDIKYIDEFFLTNYKADLENLSTDIKNSLGLRYLPIDINRNKLKIRGICGSLSINGLNIHILPKFCSVENDNLNDNTFKIAMNECLNLCKDIRPGMYYISNRGKFNSIDNKRLYNNLGEKFIEEISKAMKIQKINWHNKVIAESTYIRGRILIEKELNKYGLNNGKVWCKYSSLQFDNKYNSLIRWACDHLYKNCSSINIKTKINNIRESFSNVKTSNLNKVIVQNMKLPKQYYCYESTFEICKNLYLQNSVGMFKGSHNVEGVILNTERIFESFVSGCMEKISRRLHLEHKSQQQKKIIEHVYGLKSNFYTKPDDILIKDKKILLIDAKYKNISAINKNFKSKPQSLDIYQMISSCIAYKTDKVILYYPKNIDNSTEKTKWKVVNDINGKHIEIYMMPIDLFIRNQDNNNTQEILIESMEEIIKEVLNDD